MKSPKGFKGRYFSLAAILALSSSVSLGAQTQAISDHEALQKEQSYSQKEEESAKADEQTPIVIVSKKSKVKEVDASFASEVYTQKQIQKSHSKDIYEFLNSETSLSAMPSYGNPFSQSIDFHGYGLENGYQNIIVTLNGQRLNNIDNAPQILSQIPLHSVEKIEILKGTGSVEYGDGASAGAINIITKDTEGISFTSYFGSNSTAFGGIGFGVKENKVGVYGYFDNYRFSGMKQIDNFGQKDEASSQNRQIKLTYDPKEDLHLYLGKNFSDLDIFYPNSITLAQFAQNPKTVPNGYTEQMVDIDNLLFGFDYDIDEKWKLSFDGTNENKQSSFVNWAMTSSYDTFEANAKLSYKDVGNQTTLGISYLDSSRQSTTKTTKESLSTFLKSELALDDIQTLSFGVRAQDVRYTHEVLDDSTLLYAFDAGYNYKLSPNTSLFASYNHAFTTPSIDAFFITDFVTQTTDFNSFIKPQKVDTLTVGYNHLSYPHRAKIATFFSLVDDEIYLEPTTFANTNIDKTEKYGLDLYYKYHIKYNIATILNYAYVDTKIKKDNILQTGNEIPGVANHSVKIALEYHPSFKSTLMLFHTYKSKSYAMSDFDHSSGKMQAYHSTDLMANYKLKNFELFAKLNNIFAKENGLFVEGWGGLGVYPLNYQRSFTVGIKGDF
jgi:iron complex outermembrane receptor protein